MLGNKYNLKNDPQVLGIKHSKLSHSLGNKHNLSKLHSYKPPKMNSTVIQNDKTDEKQREPKGFYIHNKSSGNDIEKKLKTKDFYN